MRFVLLLITLAASPALAQIEPEPPVLDTLAGPPVSEAVPPDSARSLDRTMLYAIYSLDAPGVAPLMHAVNWSSERVFLASVPAMWLTTAAPHETPRDWRPAIRMTAAAVGTTATVYAMKALTQRPRPYFAEPGIVSRDPGHNNPSWSFPSGHAALSFTLATSLSLSHPEWYVIVPSLTYASLVTLSRPWLGVHYPSDVVFGAAIGAGMAVVVHVLADTLVPESLQGSMDPMMSVPILNVRW